VRRPSPTLIGAKLCVWVLCLLPLSFLGVWAWRGDLTANPISFLTNWLGDWALRILLASLALTPIRQLFGIAWQMPLRRLLGLFAFFYVCLHFLVWLAVDHFFDWPQMGTDIAKRPYITVGMAALLCLIPLAATSTSRMSKRLGAPTWRRLHRLAYAAGILASLHFLWLAKVGRTEQYAYAAALGLLLGVRLWYAAQRRMRNWVAHPREVA
jgi:methionine sulfoxide reductase heme-binding subunit